MQASDRSSLSILKVSGGDSHPKMQASDRRQKLITATVYGDSHPEMQASEGGNYEPKLTSKGVPPKA